MTSNKNKFITANSNIRIIEDLLKRAEELYNGLASEIQDAIFAPPQIRKDWRKAVSETQCEESDIKDEKESFYNARGQCYVMERSKRTPTTALIFRPCNTLTPYIIAIGHEPGASSWEQGKYYNSLSEALKELKSWDALVAENHAEYPLIDFIEELCQRIDYSDYSQLHDMASELIKESEDCANELNFCLNKVMARSQDMDASELKPCPFCGGNATINQYDALHLKVSCEKCKSLFIADELSNKNVYERLIAAWNRRIGTEVAQ